MPKEFHDSVSQTSTSTGTGNITLSTAAFTGRRTLQSVASVGAQLPYRYEAVDATTFQPTGQWETGTGTYLGGDTFERTNPQAGSGPIPVNFAAGTKKFSVTTNAADLRVIGQLISGCTYTYNADKTVATYTVNGVTYTVNHITVNGIKVIGSTVGGGVTQTLNYNGDGTLASI